MPKITIIVPVYNVEKYLKECLDSLVSQTIDNIEVICINDGSTDNSKEILEDYQNRYSFVKVINHEKNKLLLITNVLRRNCLTDSTFAQLSS